MKQKKNISLDALLKYSNPTVIEAFSDQYFFTAIESREIFIDLLKFLWLGHTYADIHKDCDIGSIDKEIIVIDEMWHTFILHTQEYSRFCHEYFGYYIHHRPTPNKEKIAFEKEKKNSIFVNNFIERKRKKYSAVYDILGRETFNRWFQQFPQEFSIQKIREKRDQH